MSYDASPYPWSYEVKDGVAIWYLEGWRGYRDEALEASAECYREVAKDDDINATLAVFGDETSLPKETQEFMGEEWSRNGRYVDCDRIGFVSSGVTAMAVKANMDIPESEVKAFNDLDEALEWAKKATDE